MACCQRPYLPFPSIFALKLTIRQFETRYISRVLRHMSSHVTSYCIFTCISIKGGTIWIFLEHKILKFFSKIFFESKTYLDIYQLARVKVNWIHSPNRFWHLVRSLVLLTKHLVIFLVHFGPKIFKFKKFNFWKKTIFWLWIKIWPEWSNEVGKTYHFASTSSKPNLKSAGIVNVCC